MRILITITFLLYISTSSSAQNTDIKSMVDSLQYSNADTLDCKADLYWRIVAKGKAAIPFLIDKLNDTTSTNFSNHCKKTKLNVGEVAYFALREIAFFPAFDITHIQFDVIQKGCWSFFDFFFNNKNKKRYQSLVRKWYEINKTKFRPQEISKEKQTMCHKQFNIDTYLTLEK